MRTWVIAKVACRCGSCGNWILEHEPMQTFRFPGVKRIQVRCQHCADEPFEPAKVVSAPPMTLRATIDGLPFTSTRDLARDFKSRQTGEREPGEDDV
jgi:hypothetical protein